MRTSAAARGLVLSIKDAELGAVLEVVVGDDMAAGNV
jgi:hypothetical protein